MAYKDCPDCGCRVYGLGCTNCNEGAYIEEAEMRDIYRESERCNRQLGDFGGRGEGRDGNDAGHEPQER